MITPQKFRIATRKSPLAIWQAERVASLIRNKMSCEVELSPMSTTGDRQSQWNLSEKGGKGLFTKELEDSLLRRDTDLAVHSAKDMPTECPEGLALSTFVEREDPRDILILREGVEIPKIMATGSPRRQAQLKERFPDCKWIQLRGNVETRLQKIAEQKEAEGTILAAAGIARLGLNSFAGLKFLPLSVDDMVPAAGQGAIAIQTRIEDREIFNSLGDSITQFEVMTERQVLENQGGGCQVAIGVCMHQEKLHYFEESVGRLSFSCRNMSGMEMLKKIGEFSR